MENANATKPSSRFPRLRAALDIIATVTVIAAGAAVVALAVLNWNERRQAPELTTPVQAAPPSLSLTPPKAPQSIRNSPIIGDPDAKLAVIEYSDFQCPYCAQYVRDVWPSLKKEYVTTGRVQFAFKHLPLDMHPHARSAALSAECAHKQGRFSDMRDLLFAGSDTLTADAGMKAAAHLGLSTEGFRKCLSSGEVAGQVDGDIKSAIEINAMATPWFLVGKVGDGGMVTVERVLVGMTSFERFKATLDELNAASGPGQ